MGKMVHYHVHPFTAMQKIDILRPISLSSTKKMIHSRDQVKPFEYKFGEYLGFHVKSQVKTESRFYDLKSLLEKMSLYHYNPLNMVMFSNLALDENRLPSVRRHEYSLMVDPTQSPTKEIKIQMKVGYASKSERSEPVMYKRITQISESEAHEESERIPETSPVLKALRKLIPFKVESEELSASSRSQLERREKISKSSDYLRAFTFKFQVTLESSRRPHTWKYFATLAGGQRHESSERKMHSEWNVDMESAESQKTVRINGKMDSPILPIWSISELQNSFIDFRFFNKFQLLESGSERWNIEVVGNSKVSHEQKKWSKESEEAKRCEYLMERKRSGEKAVMARLSPACEKVREQAATLDEVEFTIKYNNLPREVEKYEQMSVDAIKALLWPFRRVSEERDSVRRSSIRDTPVLIRLFFHKRSPSFDMTIQRPQEEP